MEKAWKNLTSNFLVEKCWQFLVRKLRCLKKFIWFSTSRQATFPEFGYPSYKKQILDCPYVHLLHVAGRLDVDTEGLLLLSNDGQFIHQVISPKRDKEKEYEVWLQSPISLTDCEQLQNWVQLDDGYLTKPAKVQQLEEKKILLTITEGKYHQVKRMLEAVENKVIYLKRLRIWSRTLEGLDKGQRKLIET